jgi:hypothetical protein
MEWHWWTTQERWNNLNEDKKNEIKIIFLEDDHDIEGVENPAMEY